MPQLLKPDESLKNDQDAANSEIFEADLNGFLDLFLTKDKSCFKHNEPKRKRHFMQRKHTTSPASQNTKVVSSTRKIKALVF